MVRSRTVGKLILQSRPQEIRRAEREILKQLAAHGFGESDCFAVRLALDEAVANAITHGNRRDSSREVTVEYAVNRRQASITVRDEGKGYNPHVVPDPTRAENLVKPGGRGLLLMRAYMNEVRHNKAGNAVTLIRRKEDAQRAISGRVRKLASRARKPAPPRRKTARGA